MVWRYVRARELYQGGTDTQSQSKLPRWVTSARAWSLDDAGSAGSVEQFTLGIDTFGARQTFNTLPPWTERELLFWHESFEPGTSSLLGIVISRVQFFDGFDSNGTGPAV